MILHHLGLPAKEQRIDQVVALPAKEQRIGHILEPPPAKEQRMVIEFELMQDWMRQAGQRNAGYPTGGLVKVGGPVMANWGEVDIIEEDVSEEISPVPTGPTS